MSDSQQQGGSPPGFPTDAMALVFDGFDTLNTKPSRPAIEDSQMFICDGFMPFGKNNLRTLYGVGPPLFTATGFASIVFFAFGNIKSTPSAILFLSDGSIQSINQSTAVSQLVAPPGAIWNPSPTTVGMSQWGSDYLIFVSDQPNGYFLWDGTTLFQAGGLGPDVAIQSGGYGYASVPSVVAIGGEGTGATFDVTIQNGAIETITVTNPGTGYEFFDIVYLAFSGGGAAGTTATATATITAGVVTAITPDNIGTGYSSTAAVTVLGGGGNGCTATPVITGGQITGYTITNGGESYLAAPTVIVTDALNTVAQATVAIMPFGVSGTAVETYQNQVWVANGSKILFTAPESASNFSTAAGGGAFPSFNSFLRVGFTGLKQSNGYLYLIADSSLNYISGVTTTGTPATTTFSNQNVDPQIGSSWPGTIQVFSRNVVFANSFGVHVSYGGAVTKVSAPLDGIYTSFPSFGGLTSPSSAVAVIFGVHVYMLLLPILDQVTGQPVNKLLMWDGKRWWTASQEVSFIWIAGQEINSEMTAWGTDGLSLYPLFQTPSTALTKTTQSRLWDKPSYFYRKMANRLFGLVNYNALTSEPVQLSIDDGTVGTASSFTAAAPGLAWTNDTGSPIVWLNSSGNVLRWERSGLVTLASAISQTGNLLGVTLETNAPDLTVISVTMVVQRYQPLL